LAGSQTQHAVNFIPHVCRLSCTKLADDVRERYVIEKEADVLHAFHDEKTIEQAIFSRIIIELKAALLPMMEEMSQAFSDDLAVKEVLTALENCLLGQHPLLNGPDASPPRETKEFLESILYLGGIQALTRNPYAWTQGRVEAQILVFP